jgi:PIN domain nuclease of toxin-antitoxin system
VRPLLLDTCAAIWLAEGEKLARSAADLLKAYSSGVGRLAELDGM